MNSTQDPLKTAEALKDPIKHLSAISLPILLAIPFLERTTGGSGPALMSLTSFLAVVLVSGSFISGHIGLMSISKQIEQHFRSSEYKPNFLFAQRMHTVQVCFFFCVLFALLLSMGLAVLNQLISD